MQLTKSSRQLTVSSWILTSFQNFEGKKHREPKRCLKWPVCHQDFLLIEISPFTLCGLSDVSLMGNGCELSYYVDLEPQVQWFVQALEKASTQVSREF